MKGTAKTMKLRRFLVVILVAVPAIALAGCAGGASSSSGPTPDPVLAALTVVSTQTRLLGGDITVTGTIKNGDTAPHDISLHASFLDSSGAEIANADGVAEDVNPGATGSFEIDGKVDPAKYSSTKVTVVSVHGK